MARPSKGEYSVNQNQQQPGMGESQIEKDQIKQPFDQEGGIQSDQSDQASQSDQTGLDTGFQPDQKS